MANVYATLSDLSTLETGLIELEKEKQDHTDKKAELLATIEENEGALKTLKEKKLETQKSVDALNLSIGEHEQKLKELDDKRKYILSGGGKNADLAVISEQIENVKADQSILEDKVCELWEQIDKLQEDTEKAAADFNAFKENVNRDASEIDRQINEIMSRMDAINGDINGKLDELKTESSEAHDSYTRLRGKSVVPAAAPVVNGNCQGCFVALPPDMVNKIYDGTDLYKCPNCYRYLFVKAETEEEAETE